MRANMRKRKHGGKRDTKLTNPKEAFGEKKLPLGLVPDTAIVEETLAFLEGALKYGQYNWRVAGVKASTYNRAIRRHLKKWWNGQDRDPLTQVLELASIRACCGILIDAAVVGMLNDDRPPSADVDLQLERAAYVAAHLKDLFASHSPPQYTQRDHGRVPPGTQPVHNRRDGARLRQRSIDASTRRRRPAARRKNQHLKGVRKPVSRA